jgi:hypothetical protein
VANEVTTLNVEGIEIPQQLISLKAAAYAAAFS